MEDSHVTDQVKHRKNTESTRYLKHQADKGEV